MADLIALSVCLVRPSASDNHVETTQLTIAERWELWWTPDTGSSWPYRCY